MAYTTIQVDAPSSAVPEDFVEATVEVFTVEALNLHRLRVIVGYESSGPGWEKDPVTLVDVYRPFQYQKFDCMFKMRYCKVLLYVYTYYETLSEPGVWHFDRKKEHFIDVGLVVGWVHADTKTASVSPSGIMVCDPGETKCVGYDLYTCSVEGRWEFTKHNATECGYVPEEKPFPWKWAGIALAALGAILLIPKKKK